MVIMCPMGMEHRLALTLLPAFTAFLSSPKSSTLCSSQIVPSVTLLLMHFLTVVPCLVPLIWVSSSSEPGLSDFVTRWFI